MTIWRMRIACWMTNATHTRACARAHTHALSHSLTICNTDFLLQQWLHARSSIRYTYCTLPVLLLLFQLSRTCLFWLNHLCSVKLMERHIHRPSTVRPWIGFSEILINTLLKRVCKWNENKLLFTVVAVKVVLSLWWAYTVCPKRMEWFTEIFGYTHPLSGTFWQMELHAVLTFFAPCLLTDLWSLFFFFFGLSSWFCAS